MTVVRPNSISGINSITVATGSALNVHDADGNVINTITGASGVATYRGIHVGAGTTTSDQGISVGTGASIVSDTVNQLDVYTNNAKRLSIDSNGLVAISTNGLAPSSYGSPSVLVAGNDSTLTLMGNGSTNSSSFTGVKFRVAGGSSGDYTKAGIFAQRQGGYNDLDLIFAMDTAADANSVAISDEKVRITSAGRVNVAGICSAAGGFIVGAAATIYANGNATYSGISTFVRASLTGSSESAITTQAATSGGTTTLDMNTSDNWIITMGGNTTIGDPSNEKVGQTGSIWLVQDGTGSRTAAWNSAFKWVGGTAPTLTTTASMIDRVDYIVKAAGEINAVISLDVK